jgi:type I restriction enzyme S subunit
MPFKDEELEKCTAKKGDLLICEGGEAGRAAVWDLDKDICFQNHIHRARFYCDISQYYAYRFFEKLNANGEIEQYRKGVGISSMSGKILSLIFFPLPPLNEQKRIVTKVDELMKLCDELEARQKKKQETRILINNAALNKLLTADTPETFTKNWQRISDNFDILYSAPENIGKLRQAILQLAVMGKLVPQDANDEPAAVLLERIKKEKERLVKSKKINKNNSLPPIEINKSYNIPKGWVYSRMGEIFVISSGTTPSRLKHEYFTNGTENWVKTTDLNNQIVNFCQEKITVQAVIDCNLKYYPIGTICIAMYGGAGTIGKSGILGFETTINQSVCGIYPNQYFLPEFLHLYVKSIRSEWMKFAAGLRKDPNINAKIINEMVLPIPPLNEQKRIVAKVDKLMKLCDELETKLTQTQTEREKIINAAVKQLLTV